MNSPKNPAQPKVAWLVGAILLTVSVSGFFMGLRQTGSQISLTRPVSLVTEESESHATVQTNFVPIAVPYAKQDWLKNGLNAQWQNRVANLAQPPVPDLAGLTNVTTAERSQALSERAGHRAFDGAPPVVPHPIAQDSSAVCLACHGEGLAVKDKVAAKISHPHYSSCTQCHVASGDVALPPTESARLAPLAENRFVSVQPPLRGNRAWPLAPPTVPHATFMRTDCLSCHGPRGLFGLRTPHPDRQSCTQCHALDAKLDQHSFFAGPNEHPPRVAAARVK